MNEIRIKTHQWFARQDFKALRRRWILRLADAVLLSTFSGFAQPIITQQPINQSVSLGAYASLQVSATTTNPPMLYQRRLTGVSLPSATTSRLALANVQATNAGDYTVVITDGSGSITSRVANLDVDTTFTKITSGLIVTEPGKWSACAWGDYDNHGFEDLFLVNEGRSALYRNNREGTFTAITNGVMGNLAADSSSAAWGDFDNDGWLDLFVANFSGQNNFLFRNNGDGTFTRILSGKIVTDGGDSSACSWAEYDNDGVLFVDDPAQRCDFTAGIKRDPFPALEPIKDWIWYKPIQWLTWPISDF
jgi:hypothetical protein